MAPVREKSGRKPRAAARTTRAKGPRGGAKGAKSTSREAARAEHEGTRPWARSLLGSFRRLRLVAGGAANAETSDEKHDGTGDDQRQVESREREGARALRCRRAHLGDSTLHRRLNSTGLAAVAVRKRVRHRRRRDHKRDSQ